jgi:hypothetical protein
MKDRIPPSQRPERQPLSKELDEARQMMESANLDGLIQQCARANPHANIFLAEPRDDIVVVGIPVEIKPEWQEALDIQAKNEAKSPGSSIVVVFKSGCANFVVVRRLDNPRRTDQ